MAFGGNLWGLSSSQIASDFADAVSLGVGWVRFDVPWSAIGTTPSTDDWSQVDTIVHMANTYHLGVLGILDSTPSWGAETPGCAGAWCAPQPAAFAAFAAAAAARYAPLGVHDWEIWNEPNNVMFWQPTPSAAPYAALLAGTAPAIRRADPSAVIVSGGLAPEATDAQGDVAQLSYLSGLASDGALAYVNAVGYHAYSFPVPPGVYEPWSAWSQIAATPTSFESILAAAGYPALKVWITEYGAPTNGPGTEATTANGYGLTLSPPPDHVDEALQATMATQSVQLAQASPVIGSVFWYSNIDLGTSTTTAENFYGLRDAAGTAKPAYGALQVAIAQAEAQG